MTFISILRLNQKKKKTFAFCYNNVILEQNPKCIQD